MATITKKELCDRIADATHQTRATVKRTIQAFLDELMEELGRGNRLEFRDFGVFESKQRAARRAQNPKTLQPVTVPPKRTIKFKAGRVMKQHLEAPATDRSAGRDANRATRRPEVVVVTDAKAPSRAAGVGA